MTRPARAAGFVLLETMVATLIVAVVLAATFAVISQSARGVRAAEETRAALMVARSELAVAGTAQPLTFGAVEGTDGRFRWRLTAAPAADGAGRAGPLAHVRVTVGTDERPEIVTLATLKLPGL